MLNIIKKGLWYVLNRDSDEENHTCNLSESGPSSSFELVGGSPNPTGVLST